jgi:hypothetical protein
VLTYALAVLAACANGLSSVLKRKANRQVPQASALGTGQLSLSSGHQQGSSRAALLAIAAGSGANSPGEDDGDQQARVPAPASEPA